MEETAVISAPIIITIVVIMFYIFRKSIFTWANVAEEKSHLTAKAIEVDMLIQAGKLLDTLEGYSGSIATIDDIDRSVELLRAKAQAKREEKHRAAQRPAQQ